MLDRKIIHIHIHTHTYIHTYIQREREKEKEPFQLKRGAMRWQALFFESEAWIVDCGRDFWHQDFITPKASSKQACIWPRCKLEHAMPKTNGQKTLFRNDPKLGSRQYIIQNWYSASHSVETTFHIYIYIYNLTIPYCAKYIHKWIYWNTDHVMPYEHEMFT